MYNEELNKLESAVRRNRILDVIALAESQGDLFFSPTLGSEMLGSLSFYDAAHVRIVTVYLFRYEAISVRVRPTSRRVIVIIQTYIGYLNFGINTVSQTGAYHEFVA